MIYYGLKKYLGKSKEKTQELFRKNTLDGINDTMDNHEERLNILEVEIKEKINIKQFVSFNIIAYIFLIVLELIIIIIIK